MAIKGKKNGAQATARQKKYHRRSPWACDECRLRKRKCDGTHPCSACREIGHDCTYEFRRPARPPTQTIRNLEEHLRYAQSFIKDLQQKLPTVKGVDFDAALAALDFSVPESIAVPPNAAAKTEDAPKLSSMMTGRNQIIHDGPWRQNFYGSSSGLAFIMRTLGIFQRDNTQAGENSRIVASLFDLPLPKKLPRPILPRKRIAVELVDAVFERCPHIEYLHEQNFREMLELVYEMPDPGNDRFLPLLHIVLAIGYLFDMRLHQDHGCEAAMLEAHKHFLHGQDSLNLQCRDLLSLQVALAAIAFLTCTSRIALAHSLIGLACSSALKLGLHSGSSVGDSVVDEARAKALASILNSDTYTSLLLGLPPFLRIEDINTRRYKGFCMDDLGREARNRHVDLMRLTALSRDTIFEQTEVDIRQLEDVEKSLHQWAKDAQPLLAGLGDDNASVVVKHDLEMSYLFAQIFFYAPFLHYLQNMANGVPVPSSQSQHALACLKIASTTILKSEAVMKAGIICTASWKSIYTLFLSVMCLIFLIAAHNGTSQPSEAWRKASIGIKVLAACRCGDDGAAACLRVLKMVVRQLNHTVNFDIEHIEARTPRICQCQTDVTDTPEDNIITPTPAKLSIAHILQGPETTRSDADKMLAQAEEMEMVYEFDDLVYLDDFGGGD